VAWRHSSARQLVDSRLRFSLEVSSWQISTSPRSPNRGFGRVLIYSLPFFPAKNPFSRYKTSSLLGCHLRLNRPHNATRYSGDTPSTWSTLVVAGRLLAFSLLPSLACIHVTHSSETLTIVCLSLLSPLLLFSSPSSLQAQHTTDQYNVCIRSLEPYTTSYIRSSTPSPRVRALAQHLAPASTKLSIGIFAIATDSDTWFLSILPPQTLPPLHCLPRHLTLILERSRHPISLFPLSSLPCARSGCYLTTLVGLCDCHTAR